MSLKRFKGREPRKRLRAEGGGEEIRRRFANPFTLLAAEDPRRFHELLPTAAERRAFAEEFRREFLETWEFIADETDRCPASVHYGEPFRRPPEFYERIDVSTFDPPDVRGVAYLDLYHAIARGRGAWWRAMHLRMTAAERAWLRAGEAAPEAAETKNAIQMGGVRHE
ncbi:MAG: hypothetical protein AAB654_21470 [Acidobacteriota bacterium]